VLSATDQHTKIFFARTVVFRWLRDYVVIPLLNQAFVQRRLLWEASELGINYRTSPLSQSHQDAGAHRIGRKQWRVKLPTLEIERRTGTVSAIHRKKRRVYLQSSEGHGRTSCCSLDALPRATMPTWFR